MTAIIKDIRAITPHLVQPLSKHSTDRFAGADDVEIQLWGTSTFSKKPVEMAGKNGRKKILVESFVDTNTGLLWGNGMLSIVKRRMNFIDQKDYDEPEIYRYALRDDNKIQGFSESFGGNHDVRHAFNFHEASVPFQVNIQDVIDTYKRWREPRLKMIRGERRGRKTVLVGVSK